MMRRTLGISSVALLGAAVVSTAAMAQAQDSLYGFKISPSVDVLVTRIDDSTKKACLRARSTMRIIGKANNDYIVSLVSSDEKATCTVAGATETVQPNTAYKLEADRYENSGFTHRGATYGALVVPFKYQLSKDRQFTGSASIGGYAGYRFESLGNIGLTATPIAFMGASSIPVKGDTADSSKNLMGFTYGLGVVGTFQNSFQTGVVLGWDRVGKNDGYKYNGKPWIALQIGYAFLQ